MNFKALSFLFIYGLSFSSQISEIDDKSEQTEQAERKILPEIDDKSEQTEQAERKILRCFKREYFFKEKNTIDKSELQKLLVNGGQYFFYKNLDTQEIVLAQKSIEDKSIKVLKTSSKERDKLKISLEQSGSEECAQFSLYREQPNGIYSLKQLAPIIKEDLIFAVTINQDKITVYLKEKRFEKKFLQSLRPMFEAISRAIEPLIKDNEKAKVKEFIKSTYLACHSSVIISALNDFMPFAKMIEVIKKVNFSLIGEGVDVEIAFTDARISIKAKDKESGSVVFDISIIYFSLLNKFYLYNKINIEPYFKVEVSSKLEFVDKIDSLLKSIFTSSLSQVNNIMKKIESDPLIKQFLLNLPHLSKYSEDWIVFNPKLNFGLPPILIPQKKWRRLNMIYESLEHEYREEKERLGNLQK